MLFHVLRHVEANHVVLAVEQLLGKRLGGLGLTDPGRSQKDKGADRAVRVGEAGAAAADGVGDGVHRFVLSDDAAVQFALEL